MIVTPIIIMNIDYLIILNKLMIALITIY